MYAEMVDDDSIRELINYEERELLTKILPGEIVDTLPLLLDLDPSLVSKIADLTRSTTTELRCSSAP